MMGLVKPILLAVLAIVLAAYAFDCEAAMTPEQATQCCDSMACSSHGHHAEDCCKTMPSMRAPFVQPPAAHASISYLVFAVLPANGKSHALDSSNRVIAAHCHAPPSLYAPAPLPLRI